MQFWYFSGKWSKKFCDRTRELGQKSFGLLAIVVQVLGYAILRSISGSETTKHLHNLQMLLFA